MLKKKQRLSTKEFDRCFSFGERQHGELVTVITVEGGDFQAAVAVSKKVSPKAVDRNRLRRQVYSLLQRLQKDMSLEGTHILILSPKVSTTPRGQVLQSIETMLRKLWS